MENNIEKLIQRALDGDMDAYQDCIKIYSARVHAIAYQMVGNSEDAQDIAQEVFIRLYRSLRTYRPEYAFFPWLYRLTMNLSIDYIRKNTRHKSISLEEVRSDPCLRSNSQSPERSFEHDQLKGALHRLLEDLTVNQRKVFVLRELQDFSTQETSQILKCRRSTVRVHLSKARKRIMRALENRDSNKDQERLIQQEKKDEMP